MMNEEVIEAGIKGYQDAIRQRFAEMFGPSAGDYGSITEIEKFGIRRAIIWALAQYLTNVADKFKNYVVATNPVITEKKKPIWKGGKEYERRSRR